VSTTATTMLITNAEIAMYIVTWVNGKFATDEPK
jgi:hypothetical protein